MKSFAKRHQMSDKLVASEIVRHANDLLVDFVSDVLAPDVMILSYENDTLTIACRNSPAVYSAQGLIDPLTHALTTDYPNNTFKVVTALRPDAWKEWYN